MIYTVLNTASSVRVFYDVRNHPVSVDPGGLKYADLNEGTLRQLEARGDLVLKPATFERHASRLVPAAPPVTAAAAKPPVCVTGHFGIGDNLHQRAVMRELMKTQDVWLHTCHFELYHDLIEQGLKLIMRPTGLHAQAKTILRERPLFEAARFPGVPPQTKQQHIGYPKSLIDQHGSILEAMFSCVGLQMPQHPDFSLPLKAAWKTALRERYLCYWSINKPLLLHRPITVRKEWDGRSRNPDPAAYDELYRSIRDQFFVVSVADLVPGVEWIVGPHQEADVKLHNGELTFEEMAALFAAADLVFCNAGFAPVLAQAVGTPLAVVYGGRESYRTTQRVGAHLAPTLPIDVINPCDCHSNKHPCDKRIDLPPALARLQQFTAAAQHRTLLFGTFYVDSPDRAALTDLWERLHLTLNGNDCDFLAVDSQSPIKKFADWHPYDGKRHHRMYFNFPDNIGHLSRKNVTQGRDGWGRAFSMGLQIACELGYSHVAHIEGDSLLRLKVADIVQQMKDEGIDCASTIVRGMKNQGMEKQWVETGLMFFTTDYIKRSNFIRRYDWPNRKATPTPERYIRLEILNKDLDSKQLRLMPWKALRADKNQITKDNIEQLDLDWVTHQHNSQEQAVYSKFVEMALSTALLRWVQPDQARLCGAMLSETKPTAVVEAVKLNLGCGTNRLAGWENHDAEIDITKPLPWPDRSASHIFAEHVVEHVTYKEAIEFFKEAHRILAPGGCLRVTVPSLQQIAACEEEDYWRFTTKWQKTGPTKRGAMEAIIYAHGHQTCWNSQLMRDTLYFAGFDDVRQYKPGESDDEALRGVEGHGRVIGDKFNLIESCSHEARKPGVRAITDSIINTTESVAVVIGGATCWQEDLEKAKRFIGDRPIKYFYVNDHIKTFPEPGIACTLHPDKLGGHTSWLTIRRKNGLPEPEQIWSHRKHAGVTCDTASKEWSGSSGLFAVQVARRLGHKRVIACGIPMTVDGSHFERHIAWQSAIGFRHGWMACKDEIAPYFRSMSGWTAELFGTPDEAWIRS